MTLLPLTQGSGRDRKRVSKHNFSNLGMQHPLKPKYELNHASRLSTPDVTKLTPRGSV